MAVLNTTSPPVSPAAPADSPSYQVPFSSASVAFILYLLNHTYLIRSSDPLTRATLCASTLVVVVQV